MTTSASAPVARDRRVTIIGTVGFAAALAAASQVALPIPGTPVPITLQPLVVVLAGLWLGPVAGAASMVVYLIVGAAGLPVFSPFGAPGVARLFGPTGGYLWAYPVAAWVAGSIGAWRSGFWWRTVACAAGIAMLHVGGVAQLAALTGSIGRAATLGTLPFLLNDVVKVLLGAFLSPRRASNSQD